MKTSFPYRRVLLVTGSHVGHNLFCTPAIGFLKKHLPHVEFDLVALSSRGASVFENNPHIGRLYWMRSRRRVRRLTAAYDVVIGLLTGKPLKYVAGATVPTIGIDRPKSTKHRAESVLEFAERLVGHRVEEIDRQYVINPRPADFAAIDRRLKGSQPHQKLVGLHLGTGRTATRGWQWFYWNRAKDPRIWPLDRYVELAYRLQSADPAIRFVLTGTANERFLGRAFTRAVPDTIDLIGKTSLLELAALMARLRLFVTNDNGALHVACAANVPLVGLFGPTRPERTGMFPQRPHYLTIQRPAIESIEPGEVSAAIIRLLQLGARVRSTEG